MFYDFKASGERIRLLRKQKGFIQETQANILNIDRIYISLINFGRKGCSVDCLFYVERGRPFVRCRSPPMVQELS